MSSRLMLRTPKKEENITSWVKVFTKYVGISQTIFLPL